MAPRLIVTTAFDYGQREAGSIYYAGYYLLADGADQEAVVEALATGEMPPAGSVIPFDQEPLYIEQREED